MKKITLFIVFLFFFQLPAIPFAESRAEDDSSNLISKAIEKGIKFLADTQLENGGFENAFTNDLQRKNWMKESTNSVPAYVLASIHAIPGEQASRIREMLVAFLQRSREPPGVWRYWEPDDRRYRLRRPDSDDTALAWIGLILNGKHCPPEVVDHLKLFRDPDGSIWTWIDPRIFRPDRAMESFLHSFVFRMVYIVAKDHEEVDKVPWDDRVPRVGDVDLVANANVLCLFGLTGQFDQQVCDFLLESVREGVYMRGSVFYPNPLAFTYALTRSYRIGDVSALAPAVLPIRTYLLASREKNGSWGSPLKTAQAAASLLYLEYSGNEIDQAVDFLIATQKEDGGWESSQIWRGDLEHQHFKFKSRAMATAHCLEVLQMVLEKKQRGKETKKQR